MPLKTIEAGSHLLARQLRLAQSRGAAERPTRSSLTEIDGLDIHFIHVRSQHEDALPLIVTHGWPGSIIEQLEAHRPAHQPDRARRQAPRTPSMS